MNDIDYGALMLEAASQDVAAEQHARMTSTAKVAVSRFWPTLAAAEDEKDLGFRIAYLQDRMVRAMADAGVGDSVVQDEVIASLREDYRTMTAATTNEAANALLCENCANEAWSRWKVHPVAPAASVVDPAGVECSRCGEKTHVVFEFADWREASLKTAEKTETCSDCNGTGAVPALGSEDPEDVDNGLIECPTCEGTGEVFIKEGDEGQKTAASEERSRKSAAWKPTPTVTTSLTVNPPHGPTAIIPKIAEVILRIEGEDVLGLSINGSPDYIVTRYSTTATTDYGNPDRSGRQSGDFTVYFPNGKTKEFHYGPSGAPRHAAEDAANSIANNARHFTRDASRKTASATIDLVNTLEGLGYTMTQPSPHSYLFRGGKGEVLVQKHGDDYAVSNGRGTGDPIAWYTDSTLVEGVQMWLGARTAYTASRKKADRTPIYFPDMSDSSRRVPAPGGGSLEMRIYFENSVFEPDTPWFWDVKSDSAGGVLSSGWAATEAEAVAAAEAATQEAMTTLSSRKESASTYWIYEVRAVAESGQARTIDGIEVQPHTARSILEAVATDGNIAQMPFKRVFDAAVGATFASRKTASQAGDPRPIQEEDEDGEPLGLPADADPSLLMASRTAGHRRTAVVACRSCSGIAVASKGSVECMDCGATTTATPQAATASSGRPRQALPPSLTGRLD